MLDERQLLMHLATKSGIVNSILSNLPLDISSCENSKIRFDEYGASSHAYSMDMTNLSFYNFREAKKGNIIDLIVKYTHKNRKEVTTELYTSLMLSGELLDIDCEEYKHEDYSLKYPDTYAEKDILIYPKMISDLFLKDNLWVTTQDYWGIRYDFKFKRIVIPVYQDGELVGAIGRLNKSKIEDRESKYLPSLVYNKTRVLFGLDEYKDKIKRTKKVILVESEKSVMKAWQYKLNIPVLAVGCSNISRHHIERLNILGVETIIWAQDKGITEEKVLENNLIRLQRYSNAKNIKYIDVDDCDILSNKECFLDRSLKDITTIFSKYIRSAKDFKIRG